MSSSPLRTRVGQVFIAVRDMPAAVEWYSRLFGFDVDTGRFGHEDTIFDIPTDAPPYLCLDANQPDGRPASLTPRRPLAGSGRVPT